MLFGGWDGTKPRKFQAILQSSASALQWKMLYKLVPEAASLELEKRSTSG